MNGWSIHLLSILMPLFIMGCGSSSIENSGEGSDIIQVEPIQLSFKNGYYFLQADETLFNISEYDQSDLESRKKLICDIKQNKPDLLVFEISDSGKVGRFLSLDSQSDSLRQLESDEFGGLGEVYLENGFFHGLDSLNSQKEPILAVYDRNGSLVLTDEEVFSGKVVLPFLFGPIEYAITNCSEEVTLSN